MIMKKQKISLQLRKQKISSLSKKQLQGGAGAYTTLPNPLPISFVVIQCATKECDIKLSIKLNCSALTITYKC